VAGSRRIGRQQAFVILCSIDLGQLNVDKAVQKMWGSSALQEMLDPDEKPLVQRSLIEDEKSFAAHLVQGVCKERETIDARLQQAAHNWTLERMSLVDRNILRLGAFEILFEMDTAIRISINEAVELAKKFGEHTSIKDSKGRYSPQFVNGVLDKVASQSDREYKRKKNNRNSRKKHQGIAKN